MRIALPLPPAEGGGRIDNGPPQPSYWKPENHVDQSSALRVENWQPKVAHLMLGSESKGKRSVVKLGHEAGVAIMRYVEEAKMFANLRDSKIKRSKSEAKFFPESSMADPAFWDEHWSETVLKEWAESKTRSHWLKALQDLKSKLDEAIKKAVGESGCKSAFVKLSVRSPKDSVFNRAEYFKVLKSRISEAKVDAGGDEALSTLTEAIRYASWQTLKCSDGQDALELLLRSDRIYLDVLQHELFLKGSKNQEFNLDVHVCPFEESFDPALEFRGFVAKGKRTSLTAYSPFVYDKRIISNKKEILDTMLKVWDKAHEALSLTDYSIDFCFSPDLKRCWVVEVNAFLPPLAGCGLFDYNNPADRKLMLDGTEEFEFRTKDSPLVENDFVKKRKDENTGKVTTTVMIPAPPHVMEFARQLLKNAGATTWSPGQNTKADRGSCTSDKICTLM